MLPELGHFVCIIAVLLALCQSMLVLQSDSTPSRMALQRQLLWKECLCLVASWSVLWFAFLTQDLSVAIVYAHSNRHLDWWYRLSALWGGHEGSVLLWVLLLSVWRLAFARYSAMPDRYYVNGVLAMVSMGLLIFLLVSSNPFARILPQVPNEGLDLNPLLQDPGMAIHPPMLYLGYVAFAIPYACALVMLWKRRVIKDWAVHLQPWVAMAWAVLTVGIVLGSWWAYRVLGWGGWWFWDPVENASLLPWFGGLLLLHGLALVRQGKQAQVWTILVALLTFVLSLLGTFLVRSGVLISVHSFAQDPTRGTWILGLITLYGVSALLLFAMRGQALFAKKKPALLSQRSSLLIGNQLILATMLATVLLGTLYPLLIEAIGLGKISVGAPYFNQVMPVLSLGLLVLLALLSMLPGCSTHSHQDSTKMAYQWKELKAWFYVSLLMVAWLCFTWSLWHQPGHRFAALIAVIASFILSLQIINIINCYSRLSLKQWGMHCAHAGFIGMVFSIAVAHSQSIETSVALAPGGAMQLGGYRFEFISSERFTNRHYHGIRADIKIAKESAGSENAWHAYPERRIYSISKMNLAKTAIMIRPTHDIYLAMGEPLEGESWAFRIQFKPMVRFIWLFALLMASGGFMVTISRRRRLLDAT